MFEKNVQSHGVVFSMISEVFVMITKLRKIFDLTDQVGAHGLCSDPNFEGFFIELHGVCVCVRVLLPLTGPPLLYAFPYDPPAYEACAQIYSVKIRAGSTLFALIRESLNCWCCWE